VKIKYINNEYMTFIKQNYDTKYHPSQQTYQGGMRGWFGSAPKKEDSPLDLSLENLNTTNLELEKIRDDLEDKYSLKTHLEKEIDALDEMKRKLISETTPIYDKLVEKESGPPELLEKIKNATDAYYDINYPD